MSSKQGLLQLALDRICTIVTIIHDSFLDKITNTGLLYLPLALWMMHTAGA